MEQSVFWLISTEKSIDLIELKLVLLTLALLFHLSLIQNLWKSAFTAFIQAF